MMQNGEFWAIGNGERMNAWIDKWVNDDMRIIDQGIQIPMHLTNLKVSELTTQGQWDIECLETFLPSDIAKGILAILPPSNL